MKTETIKFDSFMKNTWREEKKLEKQAKLSLALSAGTYLVAADKAFAAGGTGEIIMRAFDPVIELIQGVSYPVAFIMISGGMLLIMMGQKHRGLNLIKWAGIGYIGMQLAPALMSILQQIGAEMKKV